MSVASTIGKLALGSLIDRGTNRLLNRDKFNRNQFNILTGGGITGQGDEEEKDTRSKTLGGIAKTGIMSLIANAIFGPIFAPLALSLGQRFVDKKRQGLGFFEQPDGSTTQPEDVRGTFTAEGMQFENIQDALGSTDPNKDINYNTGVITDKTTGQEIGNVYDEVALTNVPEPPAYDFDDSSSDSGGSTGTMDASDFSDDTAGTPFRYGGLASLYR